MDAERGIDHACAVSYLNVTDARGALAKSLLRDGLKKALGGLAPEVVEHNVDARAGKFRAQGGDDCRRLLVESG